MSNINWRAGISTTLVFASSLNTVASGSYSTLLTTALDNTVAGGNSYEYAGLLLTFSNALTAGSGAQGISLYGFPILDGTSVPNPPGISGGWASPQYLLGAMQVNPLASFSILTIPQVFAGLLPFKYQFMLCNNTGINWTSGGTIAATLYQWGEQVV